jgi:hypothetical protein
MSCSLSLIGICFSFFLCLAVNISWWTWLDLGYKDDDMRISAPLCKLRVTKNKHIREERAKDEKKA